ncbi:methyltransferase domain-containing protein [Micromonospora sp. NPDC048909]|uniref:class I SAM-dependent methyltransferase n=1 Tax=Micromonospora sp. NPDC048909 TaxID=3155643 RepID=UPI0033EEC5D6
MTSGPQIGDVVGELLRDTLAVATGVGPRPMVGGRLPRPVIEIIERDDGLINGAPAAHYLDGPADWQPYDHRAVERARGETLDIGVGAGRIALRLQELGVPVTGLDTSLGALKVCRYRGVHRLVHGTVDDHVADGHRYDTFLLLGNNLGLFEGRERAPELLAALAALARPGAQIIAHGTDPYGTRDPVHTGYHELNRRRGRLGGQLRLRLRYRELATDWFDYLVCSPTEFAELVQGSAWRLTDVDDRDAPYYLATLRLAG